MTYTRAGLVLLALEELEAVGAGQQPRAADQKTVDDRLDAVMADLALRNIYTWGDPDKIDDAAAVHLSVILAEANAPSFGRGRNEDARLLAEARLRGIKQTYVTGQVQTADYY